MPLRVDDVNAESVVVYTAITAGYDSLKEPPQGVGRGVDFVALLDDPVASRGWQVRHLGGGFEDPARRAKAPKILSHQWFPDKRYSVWIDGTVTLQFQFPVEDLIRTYLSDCDLAVFTHATRTCLYQEARVCLHNRLDNRQAIREQVARYTREGCPPNLGLAECTVVLRRHSDEVKQFNEAWWREIDGGSLRDQISFPYVAWRLGCTYGCLPGSLPDANALFRRHLHRQAATRRQRMGRAVSAMYHEAIAAAPEPVRRVGGVVRRRMRTLLARAREGKVTTELKSRAGPGSGVRRFSARPSVAVGPQIDLPSWNWVGFDTARELSKYYEVEVYETLSAVPRCDVLLVVKQHPSEAFVAEAVRTRAKIVYLPIDFYQSRRQLEADEAFLRACSMVLVHSERLAPLIAAHCRRTYFVDHHNAYALPDLVPFKEHGFLLWLGGAQYIPYVVSWLQDHPTGHEVRLLADVHDERARRGANHLAAELGMRFRLPRRASSVAGCPVYQWTERRQFEMMRDCRAAFDVKPDAFFNQHHKPPAKAQQYLASGIPFAVNADSAAAEHFRKRGLEIPSPLDASRWLSREYWEATRRFAVDLRRSTSLDAVGRTYRTLIDQVLDER